MAQYTQAKRPLAITTPLGPDVLLLEKLTGTEGVSRPFSFRLHLLGEKSIAFDQLLGQPVTATLREPGDVTRHFHGIVRRLEQGPQVPAAQGDATFIRYQAVIEPAFAFLKLNRQSRIFQQQTVPAILKTVLTGFAVRFQLSGAYLDRDYCVQFDESDFDFASRLMEEEGIFYYFEHADGNHTMVVADTSSQCPVLPQQSTVIYDVVEGGTRPHLRINAWQKMQTVRAGKVSLRDFCFQLPEQHLEAEQSITSSVSVGSVHHTLALAASSKLNIYHGYGLYAKRFDDVAPGGGAQAGQLANIFQANQQTARTRMQQEAARTLTVKGESNCGQFTPGYRFTLQRHFDADGSYLLTRVEHFASIEGAYTTGQEEIRLDYHNRFRCKPADLPYRPPQRLPRPRVDGPQTAIVVGPPGEEIFCDQYGRIKVQFPWDLQGRHNPNSSCWVRVCQPWAGQTFGSLILPRVGQEVLIAFELGDPDQPVCIAGLYNSKQMPPYHLPEERRKSGIVTSSTPALTAYHELHFDDTPGQEMIFLHSEKNMHHETEHDMQVNVGRKRKTVVGQPLGSGSGGGDDDSGDLKQEQAEQVLIYGNNAEFIFGTSDEIVTGLEATVVLGGATELVLPLCLEIVIGANTECVVGANMEFVLGSDVISVLGNSTETIIGPVIETVVGPVLETTVGTVTETTTGAVTETITGNVIETTTGNVTETTTGNVTETTTGNITETITGNVTETTTGNITETITGDVTETTTGNVTGTTTGNVTETTTGNKTETTTGDVTSTTTGNVVETYTGDYTETKTGTVTETVNGETTVERVGAHQEAHEGARERNHVGARVENVDGDLQRMYNGALDETVDGYMGHTTLGSHDFTVGGGYYVEVGGASSATVAGDYAIEVAGAHNVTVEGVMAVEVAGAHTTTAASIVMTAGLTTISTGGLMITP